MKWKNCLQLCLLIMIAGCSADSLNPEVVEDSPTVEAVPSATATEILPTQTPTATMDPSVRVLQFWHPWAGTRADGFAKLIGDFNQQNEGSIIVQARSLSDSDYMAEQVELALQEGNLPDILLAPSWLLKQIYEETDQLLPLDEMIQAEQFFTADKVRSFSVSAWQQDITGDMRYAVPGFYEYHYLFYNQSWAQELGFDNPPANSEEFLNQACTAARWNAFDDDPDNNGTGGYIYETSSTTLLSWLRVFGGGQIPVNTPFVLNSPQNLDALEFLHQIYQLDCAWTGRETQPYRYFANRNTLFYSGTSSDWQRQVLIDEIDENRDEWTIIPYPGENGQPVVLGELFSYAVVDTDSVDVQAARSFIVWMLSEDAQTYLAETTLSVPITIDLAQDLSEISNEYPAWEKNLQIFPLIEVIPNSASWQVIGKLFEDIAWQISLFNVQQTDIPALLDGLETMANEVFNE